MKKTFYIILTIVMGINSLFAIGNITMENDSVALGAGYANDVYYSFENGEIHSVERQNWDIGFYTSTWSAGIITNGAAGVKLYKYPVSDTSGWNSIDTTELATWPLLYNSPEEWENGAFNRNSMGHPDYGWGVYNSITHDVVGDSIYLIKPINGNMKKLWIEKKVSIQNTWYIKYADLDGENEVSKVFSFNDYTDKNFVYYSMQTMEILDREPASDTWDILFTKYMGINNEVPYPVTGALNNVDIPGNKYTEVGPDYEEWMSVSMDSTKSPIGYDWKHFDNEQFIYLIEDSIAYFVQNRSENVYKLVFSVFDYTIGKIVFAKSFVSPATINDLSDEVSFSIYPNPATDFVVIDIVENDDWKEIAIMDMAGKIHLNTELSEFENNTIPVTNFTNGTYFVILRAESKQQVQKLIIRND